ncbi:HAD-IC family P-type ATPase|uniref:P-type Ca(2+) transporter n=1 Tax=Dendrosporobacter quercicolus TaxID=146817 RepID=A0A1G9Q1J4_9FIRM|nr:HAD-IC family P-type ATPase [Dendrosporobacter quercicolus]NSL48088.1 HAD-IC family P-type ATPase [Dendrosporobacter quercicolus DSM 1736]SDM04890.1 Ca2+-transporting ATPase [Dendrosporobacter quercicolus]
MSQATLRIIPGRLRITVAGMKRNKEFAVYLTNKLQRTAGITNVSANPLSGRALIFYTCGVISVAEIQQQIQGLRQVFIQAEAEKKRLAGTAGQTACTGLQTWPYPPAEPGFRLQLIHTAATGAILGGLVLKRLIAGRSSRANSEQIFNVAAVTTIIAGYPLLRRGIDTLIRDKRLSNDLLLSAASLVLLTMRESVTGLSVLWLVQLSNLFLYLMRMRSRQAITDLVDCKAGNDCLQAGNAPNASERAPCQPSPSGKAYFSRLAPWTLGIAAAVFLFTRDYRRSLAVLLAGCPTAIALSGSTAYGMAAAQAARQGVMLKEPGSLEAVGQIDTIVFENDKLFTTQQPEIADIVSLSDEFEPKQILALAAAVEQTVDHPLARMVWREAGRQGMAPAAADKREVLAQGVKGLVGESEVMVGNGQLMDSQGTAIDKAKARALRLNHLGCQVIYVAVNRRIAGLIGVREEVRPESRQAVEGIRAAGITDIRVLTDKRPDNANPGIRELGITASASGRRPDDARRIVTQLQQSGQRVGLVAAGRGSLPAMASADLGFALGSAGAAEVVQAADLVICGDDLRKVPAVVELSRKTSQVLRQNLIFSTGGSIAGIALAAAKLLSPWSAALLLNVSMLGVVLNSARLLKSGPAKRPEIGLNLQQFAQLTPAVKAVAVQNNVVMLPQFRPAGAGLAEQGGNWHCLPAAAVCARLDSSLPFGLSEQEARRRLTRHGLNCLAEAPRASFWRLFGDQFKDFMVRVLLGVTGLSFVLGEVQDALLTAAIVVANALLGAYQESRAEQSLDAMKQMAAPLAKVVRGGRVRCVKAESLVPGDLIVLEAGDRIPADARISTCNQFEVEEASLTGETLPAPKNCHQLELHHTVPGDRKNMVFMGTTVTRGRARAVVVATGMGTELGKIAQLLQGHKPEPTPLQRRLEELSKTIALACLTIAGIVFAIGVLRGQRALPMIRSAATIAVAAIPEGLSAIVVVALALGVRRMAKENILVRNMASIETLGGATVICSDKTGTLTKNEMTVRKIFTAGRRWRVSGEGYSVQGGFFLNGSNTEPAVDGALMQTLLAGALCNNAKLRENSRERLPGTDAGKGWFIDGDPTEGALLVAAAKAGLWEDQLALSYIRKQELPFESERRMMSVICSGHDKAETLYCKGAPDSIMELCTHYLAGGKVLPLTGDVRRELQAAVVQMANEALRVLAAAYRKLDSDEAEEPLERELIFCGLVGMIDPPRPEVPPAIARCKQAGVQVVMITGDHPNTARAIARELGLLEQNGRVLTGRELNQMSDRQLTEAVETVRVYARTAPQHKLRIIRALKQKGFIVAMTGDGANDAPAIKAANIGIAMGLTGADVTKEAACLTLADDNFATIVKAMQEGRSIYANIRKAIRYGLATNFGEVVLMFFATLLALPLPLLPIQLLWINLIGDGLPVIALVNDPPGQGIMQQPPRGAKESVFYGGLGPKIISRGLIIGGSALALYAWKLFTGASLRLARTFVLAQIVISQFIHIFDCRTEEQAGKVGMFSNWPLIGSVAVSIAMTVAVIYLPPLQRIFCTSGLSAADWLLVGAASAGTAALDAAAGRVMSKTAY